MPGPCLGQSPMEPEGQSRGSGLKPRGLEEGMSGEGTAPAHPALCPQARPLTRYLPIRKEDFDLKTHIESSGHGVDTCLHVVLSSKVQAWEAPGGMVGTPRSEAPPGSS